MYIMTTNEAESDGPTMDRSSAMERLYVPLHVETIPLKEGIMACV